VSKNPFDFKIVIHLFGIICYNEGFKERRLSKWLPIGNGAAKKVGIVLESLRAKIAKNAKELVEREYTLDKFIEGYINLYEQAINPEK
jgi:glycosyltransferase involved in cell wall biosynthesis